MVTRTWRERGALGCSKCRFGGCKNCHPGQRVQQQLDACIAKNEPQPTKASSRKSSRLSTKKKKSLVKIAPNRKKKMAATTTKRLTRKQEQTLKGLPRGYRSLWGQVGFTKWGKVSLPCLIVGPYDIDPFSTAHEQWFQMFDKHKGNKTKLKYLVFWYGTGIDSTNTIQCSFITPASFEPFSGSIQDLFDRFPQSLQKKLDSNTPLSKREQDVVSAFCEIRTNLAKSPTERRTWNDGMPSEKKGLPLIWTRSSTVKRRSTKCCNTTTSSASEEGLVDVANQLDSPSEESPRLSKKPRLYAVTNSRQTLKLPDLFHGDPPPIFDLMVSFLDAKSVGRLNLVHPTTRSLLQDKHWEDLLRRNPIPSETADRLFPSPIERFQVWTMVSEYASRMEQLNSGHFGGNDQYHCKCGRDNQCGALLDLDLLAYNDVGKCHFFVRLSYHTDEEDNNATQTHRLVWQGFLPRVAPLYWNQIVLGLNDVEDEIEDLWPEMLGVLQLRGTHLPENEDYTRLLDKVHRGLTVTVVFLRRQKCGLVYASSGRTPGRFSRRRVEPSLNSGPRVEARFRFHEGMDSDECPDFCLRQVMY